MLFKFMLHSFLDLVFYFPLKIQSYCIINWNDTIKYKNVCERLIKIHGMDYKF